MWDAFSVKMRKPLTVLGTVASVGAGGGLVIAWSAPLFFSFSPTSCCWWPSCCTCPPCSGVSQLLLTFARIWSLSWKNSTKFTTAQLKPQRACVTLTWETVPAQRQKLMRTWGKGNSAPSPSGFGSTSLLPFSYPSGLRVLTTSTWGTAIRLVTPGGARKARPPQISSWLSAPAAVLTSSPSLVEWSVTLSCSHVQGKLLWPSPSWRNTGLWGSWAPRMDMRELGNK